MEKEQYSCVKWSQLENSTDDGLNVYDYVEFVGNRSQENE